VTGDQWCRAEPVLTQALVLDPVARDSLLQSAFRDDPGFRDELRKILADIQTATLRLQSTPARSGAARPRSYDGLAGPLRAEADTSPSFLQPGEMCGHYRIIRLLGTGGMGQVYLAEDTDLGTPVALKVIGDLSLGAPETRARLRREAARAAQLRYHPHIATVLQFLETQLRGGNLDALVMEYVSGVPASELVADGPVIADTAIQWAIQVTRAIEFAHDKGILHCDLKPANLQIETRSTGDHVKVLDFGIARALFAGMPGGGIAGTPAYMAPEQAIGEECGPGTDVYALGVTLFEFVTGRRPYEGRDTTDLLMQVIGAPVPTASAFNPSVPRALDRVLHRAMAKRAGDRYPSMAAFRKDLEPLLQKATRPRFSTRAALAAGFLPFVTFVGFASSQALDQGLGLGSHFSVSALYSWFYWGFRSLIAPAVFSTTLLLGFAAVASAFRLLSAVPGPRALLSPVAGWTESTTARIAALPTGVIGQLLLVVQVVTLAALVVYFAPLLAGLMNFMTGSRGPIDSLKPSNQWMHELFGMLVTTELLVFSIAWFWLLRVRAGRRERGSVMVIAAGVAAILLTVFLFSARHRILSHNERQLVMHGTEPCYLIERRESTALLFCPLSYPRNVIAATPAFVEKSNSESIFTPLDSQ
jgi:serine/threonine protein kinase